MPDLVRAVVRTLLAKADHVASPVGRLCGGELTWAAMALLQARGSTCWSPTTGDCSTTSASTGAGTSRRGRSPSPDPQEGYVFLGILGELCPRRSVDGP
ncbi:hypothetical protein IEQ44_08370 [Nocardioides sp. Y6]|uniref:Uncharacterized protein n=1 Tax=Nocardioides malaquae TaxID=2773426 RepID=A0ABR9RSY0_9ACTN|nr:hypothetical protein [Nocardioides malaquae]MBE7324666.1 hypothetical protein [Nocardioides malaquae]